MQTDSATARTITGAAAGLVATAVLQPLRTATASRLPTTTPPMRREPGEFMVDQFERALPAAVKAKIPEAAESTAARSLAMGYGISFGALYGLTRRTPGNVVVDGAALGLVTWAVGYLGWLPATRLMPPVRRQRPAQVVTPILEHIVYGIVAAAAVRGVMIAARKVTG